MPDLLKEAERQMLVCNACRYCEGYCAVFPAMELRRQFGKLELFYLANLCFDCRDCFYACQYAPPHEFEVNIPKVLAEVRATTYGDFTWPPVLGGLFKRNGLAVTAIAGGAMLVLTLLAVAFVGPGMLVTAHTGRGAFYRVIPYVAMTVPPLLMLIYGGGVLLAGALRFWKETGARLRELVNIRALGQATRDALGLTYMKGGEAGCNYPDESFSQTRRWLHHLVFYGFALDFASTTVAAAYDHLLGEQAPYPIWSWPVILGIAGGIGLIVGTIGLLYLRWKSDGEPAGALALGMDVSFLALLFLASLTGLLLLALRETSAMGPLLILHLGMVGGLFLTLPYGKFAHVSYRYAALVRYAIEQRRR